MAAKKVRHSLSFRDGTAYDVWRLIRIVGGRKPVRVPLDRLVYSRRKKHGFCAARYAMADVRYPLIVGHGNRVYDGNHRAAKMIDMGRKTARVIRVTDADMARAKIKGNAAKKLS